MSFNPLKSKFTLFNKPKSSKNSLVKLPIPIASTALSLAARNITNLRDKKNNTSDDESAALDALSNRDTSSAYKEIFKKGINTLRPEILMTNEYSPIITGRTPEENQNSINVQYGNNTFVEVTNTARLLELHQILKENAINTSEILIKRYSTIPNGVDIVIQAMSSTLDSKINEIYDNDISKMKKNLFDKTLQKTNNISINNQIKQLSKDTLSLVADYVMNDYIAKKIMEYIAKIFDYKEDIESSIELNRKSKGSKKTKISNIKAAHNTRGSKENVYRGGRKIVKQLTRLGSQIEENKKFSKIATKESNFENFLDILGYLRSLINLDDSAKDIESLSHDTSDKNKILKAKKGNLKDAINDFKNFTFPGLISKGQRKQSATDKNLINSSTINNIKTTLGVAEHHESFAELIAALCYDQVSGATEFLRDNKNIDNILTNGEKFINIFEMFDKEIFNDAQKTDIQRGTYQKYFKNIEKNNNITGNITKKLFKKRTSRLDGKQYIPYETNNTIAADLYDKNEYYPGEEIFFSSALKNSDLDFQELEIFINDIKESWETFSENLIKAMCLDFDDEGKKSFDNLNTIDQLNPISYLNYYLNVLSDDLEACYINSDSKCKKSLVGLSLLLTGYTSFNKITTGFKSTLFGSLLNDGLGTTALLADQTTGDNWIEKKVDKISNMLYAETEAATETLFRNILDNLDVTNYPNSGWDYPEGGSYFRTLTATGFFEGSLGDFVKGSAFNLGVEKELRNEVETLSSYNMNEILEAAQRSQAKAPKSAMIKSYSYGKSDEADVYLTQVLNLKVTNDWLGPVISIVGIALFATGIGGLAGITFMAGYSLITAVGIGLAVAGTAAVAAAGAAGETLSAVTAQAISNTKPVGTQITASGLYTFHSLLNSALMTNISDKEKLKMPNITAQTLTGANTYFFTNYSSKWKEVRQPGEFGGIVQFSAIHRAYMLHFMATNLLNRTQEIVVSTPSSSKEFTISINIDRMKGLIAALRNERVNNNSSGSEKQAYQIAKELIEEIKNKIIIRRNHIFNCIKIIDDKISILENTHKDLKKFLQANSTDSYKIVRKKLDENKFFDKTASLLNPSYKDYLAKSYYQNFIRNLGSKGNIFTKYDTGDLRDLKIMYRVLSTKNYGFLEKEKYGRKNIYHIGIPLGMMEYLRRAAFKETGDEDYLDSSLISITIYKNNQLNADIDYVPKQYIFDMSKHILPCTYGKKGNVIISNHIKKSTDDKSLAKVIKDMEVFIFNDDANFGFKSNGIGITGIVGNRTSDTENNYDDKTKESILLNHIFDYYLKAYTTLSTGLDINESVFLVDSDNVFAGQIDNQEGIQIKDQIYSRFLRDYPEVNNDATQRELFSRSINLVSNSVLFSSNNRLKEMMTINCFERVFSILVNDKDFIIDIDEDENDISQLYQTKPIVGLTGKLMRPNIKINNAEIKNNNRIKSYIQESNEKTTSMSGFAVEIGILKKW